MKGDYYRYLAEVAAKDEKQCKFCFGNAFTDFGVNGWQPNVYHFISNHWGITRGIWESC